MIEIIKYKPIGKNTLVGIIDLYIEKSGLELYGCTYHQKGVQEWISFPSKEYVKDGEKKFAPIVRFRERSHQDAFSRAVIDVIKTYRPPVESSFEEEMPF